MMPAIAEAARFPADWVAARRPNADPRVSRAALVATAACSAVSMQPMPMPAARNHAARTAMLVGEAGVGAGETRWCRRGGCGLRVAVGEMTGGERHDGRGGVVGDVEDQGDGRGAGLVVVGGEELCGSKDEQCCGAVPNSKVAMPANARRNGPVSTPRTVPRRSDARRARRPTRTATSSAAEAGDWDERGGRGPVAVDGEGEVRSGLVAGVAHRGGSDQTAGDVEVVHRVSFRVVRCRCGVRW